MNLADVMDRIVAETVGALTAAGRPPIERHLGSVGTATWDEPCGQVTASPEFVFRYATFPVPLTDAETCDYGELAVNVVVRLLRCVPVPTNKGRLPRQADVDDAHRNIMIDAGVIFNAIRDPDWCEWWEKANLSQQFNGELGGVVEVETRFTLGLGVSVWS